MAKETKSPLSSLLRMDLLVVLVVLFVPLIFFGDKALVIIIATLLIAASRASTFYDNLKIEIHSVLILVMANVYGVWSGLFAALITSFLVLPFGKILGAIQRPPWIILDSVYLMVLAAVASMLSPHDLFLYGMLTIIFFGNGVVMFIRVYVLNDALSRRVPLSVLNIMFSYLLLKNFLPKILSFFN